MVTAQIIGWIILGLLVLAVGASLIDVLWPTPKTGDVDWDEDDWDEGAWYE